MIATTCLLPFRSDRLLSVPGIDENDAKVFEVTDVARDSFNLSDPAIEGNALPFAGVRHFVWHRYRPRGRRPMRPQWGPPTFASLRPPQTHTKNGAGHPTASVRFQRWHQLTAPSDLLYAASLNSCPWPIARELAVPPFLAKITSRSRSRIVTQCFSRSTIRSLLNDRNTRLMCTTVRPR